MKQIFIYLAITSILLLNNNESIAWTRTNMQMTANVGKLRKEIEKAKKEYNSLENTYLATSSIKEREGIAQSMTNLYVTEILHKEVKIKYADFNPDNATVEETAEMGGQLFNIGFTDEALKLFLEAGGKGDIVSLNMAGVIYYDQKKYKESLECLSEALDKMTGEPYLPLYYNLSNVMRESERLTQDTEAKNFFHEKSIAFAESYKKLLDSMGDSSYLPPYPEEAYAGLSKESEILRRQNCMKGKFLPKK